MYQQWHLLFQSALDAVGLALFVLVFPVYHALYPALMRLFPNHAAKVRLDRLRRSWVEGLLSRKDIIAAAQQTRNLTMVNSLLASSALILMGFTANLLVRAPAVTEELPHPQVWEAHPGVLAVKLLLLIVVFGVAFGYCMTSLRHLGHFNLVIGADRDLIEEQEGSSIEYFSTLINRASNHHTLSVRCLYSASPLLMWLFDSWAFLALTIFWGIKFIVFQDFAHVLRKRP